MSECIITGITTVAPAGSTNLAANLENLTLLQGGNTNGIGYDTVNADFGNDLVIGGLGLDSLDGGDGTADFGLNLIGLITLNAADFVLQPALSAVDASAVDIGNNSFTWLGTGSIGPATGRLRYFQDAPGNRTVIEAEVDGVAGMDMRIELTCLYTLTAADFVL